MNSTLSIRINKKIKKEAMNVFSKLGLDISSGVKIFLNQVINTRSIPFEPKMHYTMTPKQERWVIRQVKEAKKNSKRYTSIEELHRDILGE
ncbi:MAG TPA: type II toxin-antitoxin system RelB/DinJ family antitoxin [Candidatus Paceibacterota bacterium]